MRLLPTLRIVTARGDIIGLEHITKFSYKYSEEEDDEANIEINSDNPHLVDNPTLQEGSVLYITWGYSDYERNELVTRVVYIFDIRTEYKEEGISINLVCHEKFSSTKMDVSPPINSNIETSNPNRLIIDANVLKTIRINETNTSGFNQLFRDGTKLNPRDLELIQKGINNTQTNYKDYYDPNLSPKDPKITHDSLGSLDITLYNGNLPTYRGLRDYFNKLKGGPYVIDSRDDTVTIRVRDFDQPAIYKYAYLGEPGELLEFIPETKNRSKGARSEKMTVTTWDSDNKEPRTAVSENTSSGQTQKGLWEQLQELDPLPGTPAWYQREQNKPNKGEVRTTGKAEKVNDRTKLIFGLPGPRINYKQIEANREYDLKRNDYRNYILGEDRQENSTPVTGKNYVLGSDDESVGEGVAENMREDSQLENNPATAKVVGNPMIMCGRLIDISGVSQKHTGHYYIKECEHTLSESGYITTIGSMVRKGVNESKKKIRITDPTRDNTTGLAIDDFKGKYTRDWNKYQKTDINQVIRDNAQKADEWGKQKVDRLFKGIKVDSPEKL